ncbi:MAG: cytochrome P460 family protein [Gemmatimonadota bacterium]|nr:MAG: cytochrome P460 family protein [Gemmatimonadota bacterium]
MLARPLFTGLLCGLALVSWSCQRQEEGGETGEMPAAEAMQEVALPETAGVAVWEYLEAVDYTANWELWPDKGELYEGQEPHGVLLTTYLNSAAYEAVTGMAGSMPVGAIIVKENYMPDSTLAAITIMYKVDGYDPDNNDWYWVKRLADGTIEVEGMGAGCIACHAAQRDNDFVFTGSLSAEM